MTELTKIELLLSDALAAADGMSQYMLAAKIDDALTCAHEIRKASEGAANPM